MARFYVYDMSRYCGFISDEWAFPKDGLYESHDFKKYFTDKTREAFLVKIEDELAGFVLLNKIGTLPDTEWNMGEFFIIAKFQGKGIAREVANHIWEAHQGKWEVSVIPENDRALYFWRKAITHFTNGDYYEVIKEIDYDKSQPKRYIFSFDTNEPSVLVEPTVLIRKAKETDIPGMVNLSHKKRLDYERFQPQFWRYAEGAEEKQAQWFRELLVNENAILLVAEISNQVVGFIIGELVMAPPVYNPGGKTLMVDDFCVAEIRLWNTVGKMLILEIKKLSRNKNAVQILVTNGAHDESKKQFLKCLGLKVASEWYVGSIQ